MERPTKNERIPRIKPADPRTCIMPHSLLPANMPSSHAIFSTIGLMCALLWCTLMGHAPGFLLSSTGTDSWANARIFWLAGISLMSILFVAAPRVLKLYDGFVSAAFPLASMMGSALFALSFHQNLLPPGALAISGLVIAGAGYFWLVGRFVLMLTRTQGFETVIWCIVAAFPLRQLCSIALDATLSPEGQVTLAIALPLCSALAFSAACKNGRVLPADHCQKTSFGMPARARSARAGQGDTKNIVILLLVSAVMLAVVRALGMSGTWGNSRMVYFGSIGHIPGLAALTACLVAFAWLALIKTKDRPVSLRFQPAIIVVMAGLFIVASEPASTDNPNMLANSLIEVNDPLAHLVFWSVVSVAIDALRVSAYRIIGIAGLIYGLCSVAWTYLVSNSMITSTIVLATSYVILIGAVCYLWVGGLRAPKTPPSPQSGNKKDTLSALRPIDAASTSAESATFDTPENTLSAQKEKMHDESWQADVESALEKRCEAIAEKHGLTPREREVFLLLAQGRTRSFITEDLVLSDSTVKTHISHIYAKLGIKSRRELTDLVLKID